MARTANRMKDRRVLFGVRNGRGDGIDFPSRSVGVVVRRHDAWIRDGNGNRVRSVLVRDQLFGGSDCACALVTATPRPRPRPSPPGSRSRRIVQVNRAERERKRRADVALAEVSDAIDRWLRARGVEIGSGPRAHADRRDGLTEARRADLRATYTDICQSLRGEVRGAWTDGAILEASEFVRQFAAEAVSLRLPPKSPRH